MSKRPVPPVSDTTHPEPVASNSADSATTPSDCSQPNDVGSDRLLGATGGER
jgi:hypothetical protein